LLGENHFAYRDPALPGDVNGSKSGHVSDTNQKANLLLALQRDVLSEITFVSFAPAKLTISPFFPQSDPIAERCNPQKCATN